MSTKQELTLERRRAIVNAACKKWHSERIALVELRGVVTLRKLTGHWVRTHLDVRHDQLFESTVPEVPAHLQSTIYWTGTSLDEAAAAVGIKK